MTAAESWSLVGSAVSVILGILAIALSIYFYVAGRNTETRVAASLSKIEAQAEMLQKLAGRQLDRLTKFVTDERRQPEDPRIGQFLGMLIEMAKPLTTSVQKPSPEANRTEQFEELVSCYIIIYYYTAVANYWAQWYLPSAGEFDASNEFHVLVQRTVDASATDFTHLAQVLTQIDEEWLQKSAVATYLQEAQAFWRTSVRTSSQIFVDKEHSQREE